jgi:uncharacterized membrane protein
MTWYELLLFVHIAGAVVWLGGAFFVQLYAIAVQRGGDPGEMATFAGRVGTLSQRVFIPASLVVVLAGIGLMIDGNWDWGRLWVVFALVTFAASFVTGAFVLGPTAKRIEEAGPATPAGQELIRRIFTISRVDLLFMYAILFAMAVKPTGEDGWVIVFGAAVLLVLSAVFLAPLRGGAPEGPAARPAD